MRVTFFFQTKLSVYSPVHNLTEVLCPQLDPGCASCVPHYGVNISGRSNLGEQGSFAFKDREYPTTKGRQSLQSNPVFYGRKLPLIYFLNTKKHRARSQSQRQDILQEPLHGELGQGLILVSQASSSKGSSDSKRGSSLGSIHSNTQAGEGGISD